MHFYNQKNTLSLLNHKSQLSAPWPGTLRWWAAESVEERAGRKSSASCPRFWFCHEPKIRRELALQSLYCSALRCYLKSDGLLKRGGFPSMFATDISSGKCGSCQLWWGKPTQKAQAPRGPRHGRLSWPGVTSADPWCRCFAQTTSLACHESSVWFFFLCLKYKQIRSWRMKEELQAEERARAKALRRKQTPRVWGTSRRSMVGPKGRGIVGTRECGSF